MQIQPINEVDEEQTHNKINYEEYYDETENTYDIASENKKCEVTITKKNGEKETSIVYLSGIDEERATLTTFTNGYIEFEDERRTNKGWYDNIGNKTTISNNFFIKDIKDDKVFLQLNDKENEKYIVNGKWNFILLS